MHRLKKQGPSLDFQGPHKHNFLIAQMSRDTRFPTMWYVQPAKPQISLRIRSLIRAFASRLNIL